MIPANQIRTPQIQEKRATLREKRLELNQLAHYRIGNDLTAEQRNTRLQELRTQVMQLDNELSSLVSSARHRAVARLGSGHPNPFGHLY
jgi:ribosomal protein L29